MSQQRSLAGLSLSVAHGRHSGWRLLAVALAGIVATSVLLTATPTPVLAATFMVTTTADSGAGSLRQAILDANGNAEADTIVFAIEGAGPHVIAPTSALPTITGAVVLDAEDERLASGAPGIVIDGVGAGSASGLTISNATGVTQVLGLQIVRFVAAGIVLNGTSGAIIQGNYIGTDGAVDRGNGQAGIRVLNAANNQIIGNVISGNGLAVGSEPCCSAGFGIAISGATSSGNVIQGNLIGTNADGTAAIGNGTFGINISSPSNTIGGTTALERNIISGNGRGLHLTGGGAHSNVILGNYFGTNLAGTAAIPNQVQGILLNSAGANNVIGGSSSGAGNVIAASGTGMLVSGTSDTTIQGNLIGVAADGTTPIPNPGIGIQVFGQEATEANPVTFASVNNLIGGTTAGAGNVIANNGNDGIRVQGTPTQVRILGNRIYDNAGLGIALVSGANGLLGFPVITAAAGSDISGTIATQDGGSYRIEVFANESCDPSGSGEGATLMGAADVGDGGTWSIDALPVVGTFLTATATLEPTAAVGVTSEFSDCFLVTDGLPAPGTWVGEKGLSLSPVVPEVLTAGTFLAAGASGAGSAQFTYNIADADPPTGFGRSGVWSFYTTADATGTIDLPWRYSGFHAFFQVTVGLRAVVIRDADVVAQDTVLLAEGPANCCITPSSGFDYSGDATFAVQAGDVYGFVLAATNGDSNDTLRGELTIGTEVPTDCANAQSLYGATTDGRYVINPIDGQRFGVHCAGMDGESAREYLELVNTGGAFNFSSYATGGAATGTTVTTSFTKIRFDPIDLTVDVADRTFATSTGNLTHPDSTFGPQPVTSMPYATAMACSNGSAPDGTANVNLGGTGFLVDDAWYALGTAATGGGTITAGASAVDITANGFCGWVQPDPSFEPIFVFNDTGPRHILQLRYANEPPTVFASISRTADTADLYARVDGAVNASLTFKISRSTTCLGGVLSASSVIDTVEAITDAEGYVILDGINGVASGDFVAIAITSPGEGAPSLCVRTTGDNDYWPKALVLGSGSTASTQDVIEVEGKSRWYRFPIVPDQRITVSLKDLPADYDLAVFRDIAKEFEEQIIPTTADEVRQLSAEFAPSVFSPSVFSPSVFSPSVFSPDAYAPSVFSPSVFSPSVFSPSVFSPSVFSPSVFSPSVFSPSVFSPSVFSPSVFSPSVFSPSVFSPSVFSGNAEENALLIEQAFSSAQTRSIIGVSATPGTGDESVVVNTWNNTGFFYVRVSGRGGAFDPNETFRVEVQKSPSTCATVTDTELTPRSPASDAGDYATVILTDSSRLSLGSATDPNSLRSKLDVFAARPEVDGKIIDVASDPRVSALRAQVEANRACPFAVNLLAEEIKGIVDTYRSPDDEQEALRYITIVGDDTVIPFFRYPDQSGLGQESGYFPPVESDSISEASLRRDYVLSQDAYGSGVSVSIRTSEFPVPGLAVGRLVETPAEIAGMLDAYVDTNGVVQPSSALVSGYDFLTDAADAVSAELDAGLPTSVVVNELITDSDVSPLKLRAPGEDPRRGSWTANDLRAELFGDRHDVIYLAGHFSANSALAADYETSVITTELIASDVDLKNAIVFSGGCHSGYNLVDSEALAGVALPLDWAQAFAQKQSVLIAGTGYQYGDTDLLEYSERLYRDFTKELRAGATGSAISVGEALARAKRIYLASTPDIRGIHEKALLQATLFGLPMFGVDMAEGRGATPGGVGVITPRAEPGPAGSPPLATHDLEVRADTAPKFLQMKAPPYDVPDNDPLANFVTASWLEGPDGVVTNPAEPATPKHVVNVTSTVADQVLRGVGFRGGAFEDTPGILPLTGAPTTELRGVHVPFVSPVFYPMKLSTPNHFGALGGDGGTNLIVTPAQHKADDNEPGKSIRRDFETLDLRLFYSEATGKVALSEAPTIVKVETELVGDDLLFTAQVVGDPKVVIQEVWITWTTGSGGWAPEDLVQCVRGAADLLPVQCGTTEDSRIWKGRLLDAPPDIQFVVQAVNRIGLVTLDDNRGQYYRAAGGTPPASTSMALGSVPATAAYGSTVNVPVTLTSGGVGLVGKLVIVTVGGSTGLGVTGSSGAVTVEVPINSQPGDVGVVASFAGDATHLPSGASTGLEILRVGSSLTMTIDPGAVVIGGTATATVLLTGGGDPLPFRTVAVLIDPPGAGDASLATVITDFLGKTTLTFPTAAAGTYLVEARFGSVVTVGSSVLDLTDPIYSPSTASDSFHLRTSKIAFTSRRDGNLEIYVMNLDGSAQTRITNHSAIDTEPSYSPDGSQIVFASSRTGNGDIYKMNADGTGVVRLTTHSAIDGAPAWSPDGTKIAFTSRRDGNFEIYVMDANGSNQTRLTNNKAIDNEPEWSPDGTKLSFTSTRTGNGDIYVMNANGSGATRLTTHSAIDGTSAWSPDGTKIAFTSRRNGNFEIYVMNANGSSQTRLTSHSAIDTEPVWTADGTRIVFASSRTGNGDIYAMNPDGTGVARLTTSNGIDGSPASGG